MTENTPPEINEEAIIGALEKIVAAIQAQDNEAIASGIFNLVVVCKGEGLAPDQIELLLTKNGIEGGEALSKFIREQYAALDKA